MRQREAGRCFTRSVLPGLPGFAVKDGVLYRDDDELVLRGVLTDPSAWDKNVFNLIAFAQHLAIPDEEVSLGVSKTLGRYDLAKGGEEVVFAAVAREIEEDALPFLARFDDQRSAAESVVEAARFNMDSTYAVEQRGYSLILAGDPEAGRAALNLALAMERAEGRFILIPPRAHQILELLANGDPEAARALLRSRALATARAIGMPAALADHA